jgi:hypothetical protein
MFRRKHHNNNHYKDQIEIVDLETGIKHSLDSKRNTKSLAHLKQIFYKSPEQKIILSGYEFFELVGEIREHENQKAYEKSFQIIYELVTALKKKRGKNESDKIAAVQKGSSNKDGESKDIVEEAN